MVDRFPQTFEQPGISACRRVNFFGIDDAEILALGVPPFYPSRVVAHGVKLACKVVCYENVNYHQKKLDAIFYVTMVHFLNIHAINTFTDTRR